MGEKEPNTTTTIANTITAGTQKNVKFMKKPPNNATNPFSFDFDDSRT